jgi:hypothetical protein
VLAPRQTSALTPVATTRCPNQTVQSGNPPCAGIARIQAGLANALHAAPAGPDSGHTAVEMQCNKNGAGRPPVDACQRSHGRHHGTSPVAGTASPVITYRVQAGQRGALPRLHGRSCHVAISEIHTVTQYLEVPNDRKICGCRVKPKLRVWP